MPVHPGRKGQAAMEGGFIDDSGGQPTAPVQLAATAPERVYHGLTRNIRITNRAEKGALAGRPFLGFVGGYAYPDGADPRDESTWLQPGESMFVDRETAIFLCGDLYSPINGKLDGPKIVQKYGDYEFEPQNEDGTISGRNIPLKRVGPPAHFPDLVVQQIDARGKVHGEAIAMYDVYIDESTFRRRKFPKPEPVSA